jgi:glycosyltransferase involved in cell wall biosynthesis
MKIAINISPISDKNTSGHMVRGIGSYITSLRDSLVMYDKKNLYTFFSRRKDIPRDVDVVHYPYFEPFFLSLPLFKKAKTVVTVHDLTPLVFPKDFPVGIKGFLKWQIQKNVLRSVAAIITDSNASKKDIVSILNVPDKKVSVVYLAADEQFKIVQDSELKIQNLKKKYNLPEKFGLYVGDATANKNLPRLVDAINSSGVPLVVVGKTLSEKATDTNSWNRDLLIVQEKIKGNSLFFPIGFVSNEDLVLLYNCAAFLIMPSLYEGFGLPILEAMKCGCPVITAREGSIPEVAGDSAFYVDAHSVTNISEGIKKVFDSETIRKDLSKKGLVQASNFSYKKTAEKTIAVYESCIVK